MNGEDPAASFRRVIERLRDGRTVEARELCRELLLARPGDVNLLAILGAIHLKLGETDAAEAVLQRAIGLEPGFAKPHEDLGNLYLASGRPDAAARELQAAVDLDASTASAWFSLATACARAGRHQEADTARRRYVALSPSAQSLAEAARCYEQGQAERAEKICSELLISEPRNTRALRLLSRIAADAGRDGPAEGLLRRAIAIAPDRGAGYMDLASFLGGRSRFHEAADALAEAVQHESADAVLFLRLADTRAIVGQAGQALAAYERCLELAPAEIAALLGRGHMLRILGRRDEAIASYRRCIELDAATGDAWWNLASMKGYRFPPEQVQRMRDALDAGEVDARAQVDLHFALARAAEADGDFDAAWQHYCTGNAARRQQVAYDPVENETQNDTRIETYSRERLAGACTAAGDAVPIFIVGMPRSGSTLVEQILASHSAVAGCGELPYVVMLANRSERDAIAGTLDLAATGREYLKLTAAHRPASARCFTDKMPVNFQHLGFIHMTLPQAKIIDARRDPLDTCIGNFRQLFAQGKNHSYDLQELGEYYVEYVRLMDHWDSVLPGRILRVHYEDVVGDLDGQVRRMLDWCGLPFEEECLRFYRSARPVNTASSEQVREPVYSDAVGYWKNYAGKLGELQEILAPLTGGRGHSL